MQALVAPEELTLKAVHYDIDDQRQAHRPRRGTSRPRLNPGTDQARHPTAAERAALTGARNLLVGGRAVPAAQLRQRCEQLRRLQNLTAALPSAATQQAVAEVILQHGIELIAHHGVVGVLSPLGTHLRTWPTHGLPAELVEAFRMLPVAAPTPITQALQTGEPVIADSFAQIQT